MIGNWWQTGMSALTRSFTAWSVARHTVAAGAAYRKRRLPGAQGSVLEDGDVARASPRTRLPWEQSPPGTRSPGSPAPELREPTFAACRSPPRSAPPLGLYWTTSAALRAPAPRKVVAPGRSRHPSGRRPPQPGAHALVVCQP